VGIGVAVIVGVIVGGAFVEVGVIVVVGGTGLRVGVEVGVRVRVFVGVEKLQHPSF